MVNRQISLPLVRPWLMEVLMLAPCLQMWHNPSPKGTVMNALQIVGRNFRKEPICVSHLKNENHLYVKFAELLVSCAANFFMYGAF